ncbi:MAG: T9SS type A sorting domain-containing protein [Ignavibacteriaceae bacterium]
MKQKITATILLIFTCYNINLYSQWMQTPLNNQYVWSFAIIGTNIFAGSGGGGIFLSTNNGTSWTEVDSGLTNLGVSSLIVNGGNIFAGSYGDGVLLSTNNGKTWAVTALDSQYVWSLAVSGSTLFAGTQNGVFLSSNNGSSWTQVNSGLTSFIVNSITVSGGNIFAGTTQGIFLSTDNGANWAPVDSGLTNKYIWSLFASGSNIYAGTEAGIFTSTNNGYKWTQNGLDSLYIYSFAATDTMFFAGTNGGVFVLTKSDSSWKPINKGLTNKIVTSLAISDTNIFAGSLGVYVLSLNQVFTPTGIKQIGNNIPKEFSLSQNYPNPFNPTTTINFSIQKESFISIKVYDALGREVTTLVNEEKPAGNYKVDFNGSSLASGVYFYRMSARTHSEQAGNFVETKKLVLMK